MSFYQPSLSLYDVLNALSNQSQLRNPNEPLPRNRPESSGHPLSSSNPGSHHSHHPHHHHPRHPHPHPHTFGAAPPPPPPSQPVHGFPPNPFGFGYPDRGTPGSYFYRMPPQAYYYNPEYDYDNDDEGKEEEEEDQDQDMTADEEKGNQEPSYYHQNNRRGVTDTREQYPEHPLSQLLSSLLGVPPPSNEPDFEPSESDNDEQQHEQQQKQQEQKEQQGEENEQAQSDVEEKVEERTSEVGQPKEEKEVEKEKEEEEEEEEEVPPLKEPTATKESFKPKLKRNSSSFAHLQAPSPIPDPLQISKPETRLDLPFSPEVNLYNLKDHYVVVLALPGANSKDFKIDYHPSSHELLVKGNVEDKLGIDEKYLKITELKYGAFERTIKFPVLPRIKDEEIKATYNNGLLQIKVPKIVDGSEKPAPKKRIVIEDVPDEELAFEENPNPVQII
ncbi:heat shock protein HSP42 NDAI_0A01220 [Naumovozyma dairenensis CBS 421]|uniref:SHSP domain-containing protein n=1 Tax=Naumovozyma dairenensis (strain ATCC 10597 / BCRC 20456 / CBS 421 / NBRC 0211 / NRRL Y-12639) TaxID=1071378 RepID=G0W392_NAUDC|nr:hypothetical protein NDAI_0A01220 [Naumovozyma dairenensis CBS 421]CCD22280.1 hypothetical protein NDAI_0A01220 [Naumovozyma dairenensis CBS 421]